MVGGWRSTAYMVVQHGLYAVKTWILVLSFRPKLNYIQNFHMDLSFVTTPTQLQPNLTPVGFDNNIGLHTHISRAAPPYKPCCATETLN